MNILLIASFSCILILAEVSKANLEGLTYTSKKYASVLKYTLKIITHIYKGLHDWDFHLTKHKSSFKLLVKSNDMDCYNFLL